MSDYKLLYLYLKATIRRYICCNIVYAVSLKISNPIGLLTCVILYLGKY